MAEEERCGQGAEPWPEVSDRLTNALADALCGGRGGRERGGRGGGGSYAIARRARAGPVVRVALLAAAAKKQYLGEQAASGKTVALVRGARGLYPSMQWSIQL